MRLYTLLFNSYGTLTYIYNGPDEDKARETDDVLDNDDQRTLDDGCGSFNLIIWEDGKPIGEETSIGDGWSNRYKSSQNPMIFLDTGH